MNVLKPAKTTPSRASFPEINQKARLNFFVSFNSLKKFDLIVPVDLAEGCDTSDAEDEDEDEDEDNGVICLSLSLCFRSRMAVFQVWSLFGKQEVKIPTKVATKLANKKPNHQSPTQLG